MFRVFQYILFEIFHKFESLFSKRVLQINVLGAVLVSYEKKKLANLSFTGSYSAC